MLFIPFALSVSKGRSSSCGRKNKSRASTSSARAACGILALISIDPALAQTVVTSPGPASVAVTLYRNPARSRPLEMPDGGRDGPISPNDLDGFALVTETRTVRLPAGPATVRFEGVAGNILSESAVVAGLPARSRERNLDADLLSPRTLYDRSLGRRVLIRRTDGATGAVVTEQAVIRSGAEGAGVLQLRTGHEALQCSGLNEQLVFPAVPAGLSAKPTLSISTDNPSAVTATLTLSYLAGGFDWQADYTLTMRRDGRADLFAWVTLVSGDVTSFTQAQVAAVAGRPNRDRQAAEVDFEGRYRAEELSLRCWPTRPDYGRALPLPPPPPSAAMRAADDGELYAESANIVVTGTRIARQEELGDLKLYRLPARVTLASQSTKQVAMLDRRAVPVTLTYRSDVEGGDADEPALILTMRNRREDGLGLPLPQGPVAVFQTADARPVLLDTVNMTDKAVGEEVELRLEPRPSVSAEVEERDGEPDDGVYRYRLTVSNANPHPIRYEARLSVNEEEGERLRTRRNLPRRDGRAIWSVVVPANGRVSLDYDVIDPD